MKNGIIGWPHVAYAVPAAVNDAIEPASVIPSSRIRPLLASWYESSRLGVDGLVHLTERRVDLVLAEQRVEPERARFVGDDRNDPGADAGIAEQVAKKPGERGGGARLHLLTGAREHVGVGAVGGERERLRAHDALGHRAVERTPPRDHVLVLGRVEPGVPVGRVAVFELGVGDRQLETVAEHLELAGGELLDLVRRVARLDRWCRASTP